jgi:hypothetical protein
MRMKTDGRGGRREGAGRPAGDRNRMVSLRLSDEAVTKLDRVTNNRSEYIDRMIKE